MVVVEGCKHCSYYDTEDYEIDSVTYERTYGECRRFPPRRIDGVNSAFPIVEDDCWCGEYQKKFDPTIK